MHHKPLAIVAGILLVLGSTAFLLTSLSADEEAVLHWRPADEVAVEDQADVPASGDIGEQLARQAVATLEPARGGSDDRIEALLRGRVVDRFQAPVAEATVHLDFGRGGGGMRGGMRPGEQRRIPDPVVTDAQGRFAFHGQLYTNVRLSLQVVHRRYAPAVFDRSIGDVQPETDLGDLVIDAGGEVVGRVTDLAGIAVPAATVQLQPENDNRLRWVRDRDQVLPELPVDNNGYYRLPHVAAGDWRVQATAPQHQMGSSQTFTVELEQRTEVEDIRLGPGFELAGTVADTGNKPVAKADVVLRDRRSGRDYRTQTDAGGRFQLQHLPGVGMQFTVDAVGYLRHEQGDLDPAQGRPVFVTLQDGLKITGVATDAQTGQPVTLYAVRADRVRGLPRADGQNEALARLESLAQQMRNGNTDEAARQRLRQEMELLRGQVSEADMAGLRERMGGGPGGGRGRGMGLGGGPGAWAAGPDLGPPEKRPDGRFAISGLQEGVYRVQLQSPEHTRWRSAEIELRVGTAPELAAALDAGLSVSGTVVDQRNRPIADARVDLRTADDGQNGGRRGRGEQGGFGQMLRRFGPSGVAVVEARTDLEGRYQLKHAARGSYRVTASARGFDLAQSEAIQLVADLTEVELVLGALGGIEGSVRGMRGEQAAEAVVVALPVGEQAMLRPGNNPMARINADGSYRIGELSPGAYAVRAAIGGVGELWREYAAQLLDGSLPPDVTVRGGEIVRFDPLLELPKVGSVTGLVTQNGAPARGLQVSLRPADDGGAPQGGPGGGRGRGRMGGRNLDAAVNSSGTFTLKEVPAGSYELAVTAGDRRGSAPLHRQQVLVRQQEQTELNIQITTASLRGRVVTDDTTDPATLNGNAMLLPGLTELPADFSPWRRDGTAINARVQAGAFAVETIAAGQYLLLLSVRGRERTVLPVVVGGGRTTEVQVLAGKPAPVQEGQPPPSAAPRGQRGGGQAPGGRGNRGG